MVFPCFSHGFLMVFSHVAEVFPWKNHLPPRAKGGSPRKPPLWRPEAAGGHLPCADAMLGENKYLICLGFNGDLTTRNGDLMVI